MNEELPPASGQKPKATLFVLVAFVPAVAGLCCLQFRVFGPNAVNALVILDALCSLFAGIGLAARNGGVLYTMFAGPLVAFVFFALNAMIVIFAGCNYSPGAMYRTLG